MHASRRREYKVETAYIAVRLNGNGLPNYLSSAVAVNVQPAEINAFTVMDSTAQTAGAAFNALITATDTYGNAITGNRCLTFSGPANGPDGTRPSYPAQGSCAAGQSEVAFTGAPTLVPVTLYRAAATRLTVTDVTSPLSHTTASFTVKPAVANKLSVTQSPGNTVAGVVFATQPQVTVQDHYGNTVTTDTSNVTITVTGGTATLTGCAANPRAATGGVATFSGCKIATAGTYTLTATDGSLTPAVSVSFTISANISQGKSVVCSSLETGGPFPAPVRSMATPARAGRPTSAIRSGSTSTSAPLTPSARWS